MPASRSTPCEAPTASAERVVAVEDPSPVGSNAAQQVGLLVDQLVTRGEIADVGVADRGEHGEVGVDELSECVDLAAVIGPYLADDVAVVVLDAKEGQRDADVVVVAGLVGEHVVLHSEDCRDQGLGRGLADASGHGDDLSTAAATVAGGELLETGQGVRHDDDRDAVRDAHERVGDDDAPRSLGDGVRDEQVPITGTGQSEEQVAVGNCPGVGGRSTEGTVAFLADHGVG